LEEDFMLKQALALLSLMVLSAAGSWAFAEDPAPQFLPPERVVLYLADKLALSEDQKAAITPVIAERQTKMKAASAENNADQRQKYVDIERHVLEQMKQRAQSK
jgi:hypothetical protein